MARKRASMREGPLAELFRATEAAQRQSKNQPDPEPEADARVEPLEETVEHAPPFEPIVESEPEPKAAPAPKPDLRPVEELPRIEALPEPAPRLHRVDALGAGRLPRRDPRRRSRRRGAERDQPDDRRGHLGGRVRRRQHRHPAARDLGRAGQDPHRTRADRGPRLRCVGRPRAAGRRGELRPDQARAARLGHGLRDRGRGRRHRLRRGAGRGADLARARRAHGRHRHDAVQVRGHETPRPGRPRASRSCARTATR